MLFIKQSKIANWFSSTAPISISDCSDYKLYLDLSKSVLMQWNLGFDQPAYSFCGLV